MTHKTDIVQYLVFSGARADDAEALKEAAMVQPTAISLVTQNVYGFADFTTTIGNTVMIFSPSSIAVQGENRKILFNVALNNEISLINRNHNNNFIT